MPAGQIQFYFGGPAREDRAAVQDRAVQDRAVQDRAVQDRAVAGPDNGRMSSSAVLQAFHPAVAGWFSRTFPAPTPAQEGAWPGIRDGRHVLSLRPRVRARR